MLVTIFVKQTQEVTTIPQKHDSITKISKFVDCLLFIKINEPWVKTFFRTPKLKSTLLYKVLNIVFLKLKTPNH